VISRASMPLTIHEVSSRDMSSRGVIVCPRPYSRMAHDAVRSGIYVTSRDIVLRPSSGQRFGLYSR